MAKAELLALKNLQASRSDHVVQLLDHWGYDGHLYLAMELMCMSLWHDFQYRCWTNRPVPVRWASDRHGEVGISSPWGGEH